MSVSVLLDIQMLAVLGGIQSCKNEGPTVPPLAQVEI